MNERAIDLYKEAANYAYSTFEKEFWGTEAFQGVIVGKFAELIVQECANIVNSLEQYEGQGDCSTAEYIKERFGVE